MNETQPVPDDPAWEDYEIRLNLDALIAWLPLGSSEETRAARKSKRKAAKAARRRARKA